MSILTPDFVLELSKACLTSEKILEICKIHLKFQYLENETQKRFFQFLFEKHNLDNIVPSFGILSQAFSKDEKAITFLNQVKSIREVDNQQLLGSFEEFVKEKRFKKLYNDLFEAFSKSSPEDAYKLLQQESASIYEFTLKEAYYNRVFKDFITRHEERQKNADNHSVLNEKCTYGIHAIDDATRGGFEYGTAVCVLARSGVGKSTYLKWVGLCNARLGKRVVHFQAEGTEKEALELYDAAWTSINLDQIEIGVLPEQKRKKIEETQRNILANGGEVFVYAKEKFDSMSINECREILLDIQSIHGKIDLVIFDYLEIFTVKGSYSKDDSSERKRREDVGNKIVNIGTEFKCGVLTATQANDIAPVIYNNPETVLTRHHIAEYKAAIKPFSAFLTLNQTSDEYEEGVVRIHSDKFRKHMSGQTWSIAQSRENGRFYDSRRTVELFGS